MDLRYLIEVTDEKVNRPLLDEGAWQQAYERALVFLASLGGLSIGLGILSISPPGFDGFDLVAWFAIGVGVGAAAALLFGHTNPVPFLVLIVILVGVTGPFVDLATALALSTILISVLSTGSLLIQRSLWLVGFVVLTVGALALRPLLDMLAPASASAATPIVIPWLIAMVTLIVTVLAFRSLRDQIVSKKDHQDAMNELVSKMAHHIRTPLTAAIGFSYLLRAELEEGEAQDYADGVIRRGWEIAQGVDDLVVVTRSDARSLEVMKRSVDLAIVVNRILDQVPGARVKLRYMSVDAAAIADPQRVIHIVRHLVRNAVTHGGPTLTIHTRIRDRMVDLHLHDDGAPLSEEDLRLVFEPFVSLRESPDQMNPGVGLTVSRMLARAMGGDVVFKSDHDGNTVVLSLPGDPRKGAPVAPERELRRSEAPGQPA